MTKPACRLGDQANCSSDSHGGDCCPHNVTGSAVSASPDVFINGRPALRVGDTGVHSACSGPHTRVCVEGSGKVNGLPLGRRGDAMSHCGGAGTMSRPAATCSSSSRTGGHRHGRILGDIRLVQNTIRLKGMTPLSVKIKASYFGVFNEDINAPMEYLGMGPAVAEKEFIIYVEKRARK